MVAPATSFREVCVGVGDIEARRTLGLALGLKVLAEGRLSAETSHRLLGSPGSRRALILGRDDVPDAPRIRVFETAEGLYRATALPDQPGPLGLGFSVRGIARVQARLADLGVAFLSEPLELPATPGETGSLRRRTQSLGRTVDGDFITLFERPTDAARYGAPGALDVSEPLDLSYVVTDLDAATHFMVDVLGHEELAAGELAGRPFEDLLRLKAGTRFRFSIYRRPGFATGRLIFVQFEESRTPMPVVPTGARGINALRFDCEDLHDTLTRVPGGGGTLVRGPATIDDPILGPRVVASIRAPFGLLLEFWQRR